MIVLRRFARLVWRCFPRLDFRPYERLDDDERVSCNEACRVLAAAARGAALQRDGVRQFRAAWRRHRCLRRHVAEKGLGDAAQRLLAMRPPTRTPNVTDYE